MTQTDTPREAFFERLRVARIGADGAGVVGTDNAYVTDQIVRLLIRPNVRAGKEIEKEDGRGNLCMAIKQPDVIRRYDVEVEICGPDPELTELLAGGAIFRPGEGGTTTTGYRAPRTGVIPKPNGVSIEGWSDAVDASGAPLATNPFMRYALPKVFLTLGDFSLAADAVGNTFTGYATENPGWGTGPFNDWDGPDPVAAWQRYRVAALPASHLGYIPIPAPGP